MSEEEVNHKANRPEKDASQQFPLIPGTMKVELIRNSNWSAVLLVLLLLCGAGLCVAWVAIKQSTERILHPESKLSVLELEQHIIKVDGLDAGFLKDKSKIGISFDGFAWLGVDLSKATFDLDRLRRRLVITLPKPEVTEVNVTDTRIWDRETNPSDEKALDQKECTLCNEALSDFRNLANDSFYVDTANQLAKSVLRSYYKRNYHWLNVEFK